MPDITPTLEPDYDFRTSCSKDEALQYLLGWLSGPIRENLLTEEERHTRHLREDLDDALSVFDHLRSSRESIEADYSNAVYEQGAVDDILAKLSTKALQDAANSASEVIQGAMQ